MFSRRQTCQGKSQKPRSLDSREEGNQISGAYRRMSPWEMCKSSGRNEMNVDVASKVRSSEGRACNCRVKATWIAEI